MAAFFQRLAWLEAWRARRWYQKRSPATAERFRVAMRQALASIESGPEQWRKFCDRFRWFKLRRFPDLVCYEVLESGDVLIMAVAHASRRPGYWRRRKRPSSD